MHMFAVKYSTVKVFIAMENIYSS